jgi:hypothetical protein
MMLNVDVKQRYEETRVISREVLSWSRRLTRRSTVFLDRGEALLRSRNEEHCCCEVQPRVTGEGSRVLGARGVGPRRFKRIDRWDPMKRR